MQTEVIPCSVGVLTLNVERELPACLDSLRSFAEIIICDGNSTDRTAEVARSYGAKVIKQYDTDEPDLPCAMDKAAVRQKNMEAATHDWYFFMDADDTLSPEAAEEIRAIVADPNPKHLIWRMPTRIFIDSKEILHEATYPSYQVRLVHKKVGARFKNPVHDHLVWDARKFSLGTMRSYYNFHWSRERVAEYGLYLGRYVQRELATAQFSSFAGLLYQTYRRLRTIAGYVLWRLPMMYARWGFRSSMPLLIELTIVKYHLSLLVNMPLKYIATRSWYILLRETLRGKDLNRTLSNMAIGRYEAYGRVLDMGGDGGASYWRFLRQTRWFRKITIDINPKARPDIVLDIEKEHLPFADGHFDTVLFFNVLEHVSSPEQTLAELYRVLRAGGTFVGVIPFLVNVHPDPHDYQRFTKEGLERLFTVFGFSAIEIRAVGTGPFGAAYSHLEFLLPRILKLFCVPLVLLCDGALRAIRPGLIEKFPLSYTFFAQK